MRRVALITGGKSAEREVAFLSAANVQQALEGKYQITTFDFPGDIDHFLSLRSKVEVVVPVFHGVSGEDGSIQGFCETLGVPFVFSGIAAQATTLDKARAKLVVAAAGVATPRAVTVHRGQSFKDFVLPVVVKPINAGSTFGVSIVRTAAELAPALIKAFTYCDEVLVENFIEGDEFTVGVLEEHGLPVALPVVQIRAQGFFDYEQKYNAAKLAEEECPAKITPELTSELQKIAGLAHRVLGCRHLSRTDIIVDRQGKPWYLETNAIPGMTVTSLWPKALQVSGRDFGDVLGAMIEDTCK